MIENIHNNEQVLQQIEWPLIVAKLKGHAYFDTTLGKITAPIDPAKLDKTFELTDLFLKENQDEDYYQLIQEMYFLGPEISFNKFSLAIEKGLALRLTEINQIALSIEIFLGFHKKFESLSLMKFSKEKLQEFKQKISKDFLKDFRKFVSREGEVDFEKHTKLRPLYLQQVNIEQKVRAFLSRAMNEGELAGALQFQSFDIINDHYVLPIRSDSYQSKFGQIVSRSETGHTLFIEPHQIAKFNNDRLELLLKIDEIISLIELETIQALNSYLYEIKEIFYALTQFDHFNTRAKFASELLLCRPELIDNNSIIARGMFHPLISNPVKNDFELTNSHQGLIISGPNTGGKTATLKTLALMQLFLKMGLFLPAREVKIYPYKNIYFFGNDQQNLEAGLSSFSAEVTNYTKLLSSLTSSHLILIDEIFNSTSSEEASALALAIFEKLREFPQTHIVVSSHHQTLKTILHQHDHFISAHVGFNPEENKPTYKIEVGAPGSSFALNIFKSMTKDNRVFDGLYEKAIGFLDNKAIHYEKLLEQIAKKENSLHKTLLENKQLNLELKNQKASMDGVIKLKIDEKIKKASLEIDKQIAKAKELYFQVKNQQVKKEKKIFDTDLELKSDLKKLSPFNEKFDKKTHTNLSDPHEFIEGERYFSTLLNKTVVLKQLNLKRSEAQVSMGNLSIKTPLSKLKVANKNSSEVSKKPIPQGFVQRSEQTKLEYDCRGMRLEAFQDIVHQSLSNLLLSDIPYLNIIHGHGNGILKKWLRDFIKNHKDIKIDNDETGNDGSTRIILK